MTEKVKFWANLTNTQRFSVGTDCQISEKQDNVCDSIYRCII